jgi:hypothetical protein
MRDYLYVFGLFAVALATSSFSLGRSVERLRASERLVVSQTAECVCPAE